MSFKTLNIKHSNKYGIPASFEKRGFLSTVTRTVLTWQERASMRHQLASLNEENLSDIGLTAHQAAMEARKPFWQH
ncbi:MAG: DUF1127 domain-containing protein [Sneathiellales bacterium]|nr:DUF1127 domain-containing protein [Sneathiellales bacterium]